MKINNDMNPNIFNEIASVTNENIWKFKAIDVEREQIYYAIENFAQCMICENITYVQYAIDKEKHSFSIDKGYNNCTIHFILMSAHEEVSKKLKDEKKCT